MHPPLHSAQEAALLHGQARRGSLPERDCLVGATALLVLRRLLCRRATAAACQSRQQRHRVLLARRPPQGLGLLLQRLSPLTPLGHLGVCAPPLHYGDSQSLAKAWVAAGTLVAWHGIRSGNREQGGRKMLK